MKTIKLSLVALMAMGSLLQAGGDFEVVTPYETEDVMLADETYVEPVVEPVPEPEPEPIPEPVVEPEPVVVPVPAKEVNPSGFYAGLGITAAHYDSKCNCTSSNKSGKDNTAGAMARVGYDFNKYVGIEARGIRTNWKADGAKVQHAGVFLKPMVPVGDATNVYGLAGIAKTKTQGSLRKTNATGLALGLGVEVDLSKDTPKEGKYGRPFDGKGNQEKGVGVFVDYERMLIKSGAPALDAVSAGVTYDF